MARCCHPYGKPHDHDGKLHHSMVRCRLVQSVLGCWQAMLALMFISVHKAAAPLLPIRSVHASLQAPKRIS
eukprot:1161417-Pelagomonas_calceolata.AAC.9